MRGKGASDELPVVATAGIAHGSRKWTQIELGGAKVEQNWAQLEQNWTRNWGMGAAGATQEDGFKEGGRGGGERALFRAGEGSSQGTRAATGARGMRSHNRYCPKTVDISS